MKKSNKILLGGFLTLVLILVSVYVTLYARYKAGHLVPFNGMTAEEAIGSHEFANAHRLDIRYFKNVSVRRGDRMKVEQFGYKDNEIILTQQGGTVLMSLKDTVSNANQYGFMVVYVPENSTVSAHQAILRVEGTQGKTIQSLQLTATESHVSFQQAKNMVVIDSLDVKAVNSTVIELQNARVNKLSVQLSASELLDQQSAINQFHLNADSTSRISLQAKHLIKLTTKTTAHE